MRRRCCREALPEQQPCQHDSGVYLIHGYDDDENVESVRRFCAKCWRRLDDE